MKGHVRMLVLMNLLVLGSAAQASETIFYVHTDHLGSPIAYTDENGNVIGREYYTPYGESLNPPTTDDTISYTGHYRDGDTGLLYMQARYYDPEIGRFLSVDPVTFSPDKPEYFNRYWYAGGNPVNNIDPDGRCYVPPVAAGCAIAGGAAIIALGIYKYNTDPNAKASLDGLASAFVEAASEVEQALFNENKADEASEDKWKGNNPRETKGRVNTDRASDPDKDWENEFGGTAETEDDGTKISPNGERFREGKAGEGPRIDIPAESSGNSKHETIHYPPRDE